LVQQLLLLQQQLPVPAAISVADIDRQPLV
jgi:hypothetical protein